MRKIIGKIRSIGSALLAAGLFFLAVIAAMRLKAERQKSRKWQDRSVADAMTTTDEALARYHEATERAKQHDAKATEAKRQAEARIDQIGARDETVADIVDRWRADGLRDEHEP